MLRVTESASFDVVLNMLGVVSRIRLVADVDVRFFELGFNKFGFGLEFI